MLNKQIALDNLKYAVGVILAAIKAAYTQDRYTKEIYANAAAYWKEGSRGSFNTRMNATIKFGLTSAFEEGADKVGVAPDEFEASDKELLLGLINDEKSHVGDLLDYLDTIANNPQGKLSDADMRLSMWSKRYSDVYEKALINFGGKTRLQWTLGVAEHCDTCSGLSNITAWAQEWEQAGIKPKSPILACHGFNCACSLVPTEKRRTPKALNRIMDIVEATHA